MRARGADLGSRFARDQWMVVPHIFRLDSQNPDFYVEACTKAPRTLRAMESEAKARSPR